MKSIYEFVKEKDYLKNIAKTIEKAGAEKLLSKNELTLFCPNDSAFGVYPGSPRFELDNTTSYETESVGKIENILETKETALDALNNHLINRKINTKELGKMDVVVNAAGKDIPIVLSGDQVMVGNATILIPDIECTNGIIHIINIVLTPAF